VDRLFGLLRNPKSPADHRANTKLAAGCLAAGLVTVGVSVVLQLAGLIPARPTGSAIRTVGILLVAGFLAVWSRGVHADRAKWERASSVGAGSAGLAVLLAVITLLHGFTGVPIEGVALVIGFAVICGAIVTVASSP